MILQYTNNSLCENILFKDYSKELKYNKISKTKNTNWFNELKINYETGISNTFILTGNIFDYALARYSLDEYLISKLIHELNINEICFLDYISLNKNLDLQGFDNKFNSTLNILKNGTKDSKKALILKYPEFIMPNNTTYQLTNNEKERIINLHSFIMDNETKDNKNIVIIMVEKKSDLNELFLSSSCRSIILSIDYPNLKEREEMIQLLDSTCKYKIELQDFKDYNELAQATCGLTRINLEEIWRRATIDKIINRNLIKEFKRKVLQKEFGEYLEIYEPNKNLTLDYFGGMDFLKDFFKNGIIEPIKKGDKELIPNGMLFMGPPGTGKTYLAKCLASESAISFAELKISNLYTKWVGDTEKKLQKALNCIKSLSPVIVLIDEIDQMLIRGSENNNHTVGNVFQMMLSFISDTSNRGDIIWIGATNYPNKLDEALKRTGRFDIKIVFSPPINEKERKDIFECHINKIKYPKKIDIDSKEFKEILDLTKGYTQAEIEAIVLKATSLYIRKNEEYLDYENLIDAIKYIKRRDSEEIENMIKIAIDECNDLEFLSQELYERYLNKSKSTNNEITNDIFL